MWKQKECFWVFGMGWTWVAGSKSNFSKAKHNSHKPWDFTATFFIKVSKKHYFRIFGLAAPEARPESRFSGMHILGDCTLFLCEISQRPEVSSVIIVTMENMKNDVQVDVWVRYPSPIFELPF